MSPQTHYKRASNVVVVGYFALDDDVSNEAFQSVAETLHKNYLFSVTNDEQINVLGIVLYKNFGKGKISFELTHDSQAITAFVKAAGKPLAVEFLPKLHGDYVAVGLYKQNKAVPWADYSSRLDFYLATSPRLLKLQDLLPETVRPLAKKFKDRIQFGTVDVKIFDSLADGLLL